MKKLTLLLATFAVSGMASAVQLPSSGSVTTNDCALLNENVRINLTSGVQAGVSCNDRAIAIAACHTAGRTSSREVEKFNCTTDQSDPPVKSCVSFDPKQYETKSGPAMATASTISGTVVPDYPAGSCDAAAAETSATSKL
ncbi:hypothetical protein [Stutzerimonas stutzeri]|uniref:hypothetical protein n=1 Tax=Stutzerimonas stutzeri TaxID=316 RepID=UPI001117251E|nr:hypothetical protein [Stutzerimonas stutzeri]